MEPTYKIAQALHARRAAVGLPKYGQHLSADSPGCMIVHALEEAADQVNYLIAEIQRRQKLMKWLSVILTQGGKAHALFEELGGESALAQYDEILGGGTVAENATVDPSDEALRVATEALENIQRRAEPLGIDRGDTTTYLMASTALAAIRAAGGGR